ncbi:MAG: spondin domain-containing protein [Gammaproteobacteria bacterium]|nr:spondin domain-containing protein [Gammaproteobacteria bacterium]
MTAKPGDKLSFATMFVQSNDWFYGPKDGAIALFGKNGKPLSGDIIVRVSLFDTGTEVSEPPGVGQNQAPRQSKPNTVPSEDKPVRIVGHEFQVPSVSEVIKVTVTATATGFV